MSANHSHGKRIAAMMAADGIIYYVGIEKIASSTDPKKANWRAVFSGTYEAVVKAIFRKASLCVTGMQKGASSSHILPENYIAGWMRELANPLVINADEVVVLHPDMAVILERLDQIADESATSLAATLRAGAIVRLSLRDHFAFIVRLGVIESPLPVHGFTFYMDTLQNRRNPELGREFKAAKPANDLEGSYLRCSVDGLSTILELGDDHRWRNIGEDSDCLREFVRTAAQRELAEPGTFRHLIKAYRVQLASAPLAPMDEAVCVVDLKGGIPKWHMDKVTEAQEQIVCRVESDIALFKMTDVPEDWSFHFTHTWSRKWSYWVLGGDTPSQLAPAAH